MLSALYAIANSSVRPSVCPSVRPSHGWISRKRLSVSSKFFHLPNILVFRHQRSLRKSNGFTPNGGSKYSGGNNFRPICGYISETVIDRGTFTIGDEYKVVWAFDDLEWPRTPVSWSQYSLKANILQTVHPIHSMATGNLPVCSCPKIAVKRCVSATV